MKLRIYSAGGLADPISTFNSQHRLWFLSHHDGRRKISIHQSRAQSVLQGAQKCFEVDERQETVMSEARHFILEGYLICTNFDLY